jgi:hypothetical protein
MWGWKAKKVTHTTHAWLYGVWCGTLLMAVCGEALLLLLLLGKGGPTCAASAPCPCRAT